MVPRLLYKNRCNWDNQKGRSSVLSPLKAGAGAAGCSAGATEGATGGKDEAWLAGSKAAAGSIAGATTAVGS